MKNKINYGSILEYIDWRGDLSFSVDPFNCVDSLILSELSYIDFKDLNNMMTIHDFYELYQTNNDIDNVLETISFTNDVIYVLDKMANSKRFKDLVLYNYINKIDIDNVKQFSAISIILPDNIIYVSYRGTDNTIVGWKEDFYMTFKQEVPSQKEAVDYIDNTYNLYQKNNAKLLNKLFNKTKIIIGGHSKGGNLAMYAAMKAPKNIFDRIIRVDNFDGPGFIEEVITSEEFIKIKPILTSYRPSGSIFGMLLSNSSKEVIIETNIKTVMQHSGLMWLVKGNKFCVSDKHDEIFENSSNRLNDILNKLSLEERESLVNEFFGILEKAGIVTLDDLSDKLFNKLVIGVNGLVKLDSEYRTIIISLLKYMLALTTETSLTNKLIEK